MVHTEASLGFGGQEIRILTETRWLLDHGWGALVLCQPESRLRSEAEAASVPVVTLRMRGVTDVAAFLSLRRLLRDRRVDLLHTHSSVDSWLGGLAAKARGVTVVRSRHVTIPVRRAAVYRLADRIIASGERAGELLCDAGVPASKIVAIPPGVDVTRFHEGVSGKTVRDELELRGPLVGLVANVRGSKGHRYFLEAAQEVLRDVPDARFLIVGDGVGFDDVRRRVSDMSLDREVLMVGFRRDIPEVMAALDVFVLPSLKSEGTSQAILQSLAVGTPVVATRVGGSPELIRDGETGRLVPPADSRALAIAIVSLLRAPERAREMARRGQAMVRASQSLDAVMTRTTAVYAELLAK